MEPQAQPDPPRSGRRLFRPRADLDVGVVYTYEHGWMPRLLSTLYASAEGLRRRLLLVDNASTDGPSAWLRYFPETVVLENRRRLHYAANLNRILEAARAPYILVLNTDMFFDPPERCLAKMVDFMRRQPQCGVSGCRLYHPDGSYAYPARRFQTPRVILARRFGLGRWLPGALDHYLYRERSREGAWECDWLSGCFLLLRRRALDDVGPFDDRFRKYFEDVDMCLRMSRAGWIPMFNGATYGYHFEGRASARLVSTDAWQHLQSYFRWLRKWGFAPQRHVRAAEPGKRRAA